MSFFLDVFEQKNYYYQSNKIISINAVKWEVQEWK